MSFPNDSQLLHARTHDLDEPAFRALVEHYAGLVDGAEAHVAVVWLRVVDTACRRTRRGPLLPAMTNRGRRDILLAPSQPGFTFPM